MTGKKPTKKTLKNRAPRRKILLVTGLSGAGLSTALKSLEDLGYKAIDNLPLSLLDGLLRDRAGKGKPLALGLDSRTWDFTPPAFLARLARLKKDETLEAQLVFINCQDNILQQR